MDLRKNIEIRYNEVKNKLINILQLEFLLGSELHLPGNKNPLVNISRRIRFGSM